MKAYELKSCVSKIFGMLLVCLSGASYAAERGACYFHVENGERAGYYKLEWQVLYSGGAPVFGAALYKARPRDDNTVRDTAGHRIDAGEEVIALDSPKELKYGTKIIGKNSSWQTQGLSWAQSTNYDFVKKNQGWFLCPTIQNGML
jgi:hypothetical protein